MLVQERTGARIIWISAAMLGSFFLSMFMLAGPVPPWQAQAMLIAAQAAMVALNLAFWAMLPDTVEHGECRNGVRVEAIAFGVASFIQKCAIGAGVGLPGLAYQRAGYVANVVQSTCTIAAIRAFMLIVPAAALALSAAAMLANPIRRGTHARIVAALSERSRL